MCKRLICFVFVAVISLTLVTADAQTVKVNFQSRTQGSREVPEGYLPDYGDLYGDQGNGFSYGWSVDKQASSRDRDIHSDQRYDTLNALNMWNTGLGSWEIEIPNGTYDVFIVGGDPGYTDQTNSYIVEGVEVLDETPNTSGNYFDEYNVTVTVNDGRLTLDPVEGVGYIKICFIHATDIGAAKNPVPSDRQLWPQPEAVLEWDSGAFASQHDVYFGENFDAVEAAHTSTADIYKGRQSENMYPADGSMSVEPGKTYYWRIDEVSGGNTWKGDVWTFTVQLLTAYYPTPGDGALFVTPDATLSWNAGATAQTHLNYFSDDYDTVVNAAAPGMPGFASSLGANVTTWDPPGNLDLNKTYYWRVDEQEAGGTTNRGEIWSFMTTSRNYGGLKGEYFDNMELSGTPAVTRIDPLIDFDWQYDSPDPLITNVDSFSVRWTGQVEIPGPGEWTIWLQVEDEFRFWFNDRLILSEAPGLITWYEATVSTQAGLYPVVFEYLEDGNIALARLAWQGPLIPVRQIIPTGALLPPYAAGSPYPANNAVDVETTPILQWSAGDRAAQHELYFGTDLDAVENATTASPEYVMTLDLGTESYDPGTLEYNSTYYWRVDEVNSVNPDSPWVGQTWNFTTGNFILVDNFESYSDYPPDEVWNTWIDGYGVATNGSSAGYPDPDFNMGGHYLDNQIVHTGRWSMPIFYDNTAGLSEVTRAFDSSLRDWTRDDVATLTLFYQGDPNNSPEPMYVALNGNAVVTNDDANAALVTDWVQWDIPLQDFADKGVNLTNVNSMSIGLGNKATPVPGGGSGHMFIDDIRLYK